MSQSQCNWTKADEEFLETAKRSFKSSSDSSISYKFKKLKKIKQLLSKCAPKIEVLGYQNDLGGLYYNLGKMDSACYWFSEAYTLAKSMKEESNLEVYNAYRNKMVECFVNRRLPEAIEVFQQFNSDNRFKDVSAMMRLANYFNYIILNQDIDNIKESYETSKSVLLEFSEAVEIKPEYASLLVQIASFGINTSSYAQQFDETEFIIQKVNDVLNKPSH
jgi:tetratricopeptide (TPR) repeat protein